MKSIFKLILMLFFVLLSTILFAQPNIVSMKDSRGNDIKVEMDVNKGTAHRIYNLKTNINDYKFNPSNFSEMYINELSQAIFSDYKDILNINPASYKLNKANNVEGVWFISYEQIIQNIPIYNTELGYTINKKGDIVTLGGNFYSDVSVNTTPNISIENAVQIAKKSFKITNCEEKKAVKLLVYPVEDDNKIKLYLAWKIILASTKPLKQEIIFVSAENGEIIDSFNNMRESSVSGTVSGSYWPQHYYDNTVNINFTTTNVRLYDELGSFLSSTNTNSNGYYSISGLSFWIHIIEFSLQDNYIRIRGNNDNVISSSWAILPGTVNKNWGATNGSNVRWHADVMHD